jgi:hypothetical protein
MSRSAEKWESKQISITANDERSGSMNATTDVWKDLAGNCYPELVRSKESALAHLFDTDSNVRIAAINICDRLWNCSADQEFVVACRRIADADIDDSVRVHAVSKLGKTLQSSKDRSTSLFLAQIVKSANISEDLRRAAYWALREVQFGLTEEDNVKRTISLIKMVLRKKPKGMSEEQVKNSLFGGGQFSNIDWNTADQIDWGFVNQIREMDVAD